MTTTDAPTQAQFDAALAHYRAQQERLDTVVTWCKRVYARESKQYAGTPAQMQAYHAGHRNGCVQTAYDILVTLGHVPGGEGDK